MDMKYEGYNAFPNLKCIHEPFLLEKKHWLPNSSDWILHSKLLKLFRVKSQVQSHTKILILKRSYEATEVQIVESEQSNIGLCGEVCNLQNKLWCKTSFQQSSKWQMK